MSAPSRWGSPGGAPGDPPSTRRWRTSTSLHPSKTTAASRLAARSVPAGPGPLKTIRWRSFTWRGDASMYTPAAKQSSPPPDGIESTACWRSSPGLHGDGARAPVEHDVDERDERRAAVVQHRPCREVDERERRKRVARAVRLCGRAMLDAVALPGPQPHAPPVAWEEGPGLRRERDAQILASVGRVARARRAGDLSVPAAHRQAVGGRRRRHR